MDLIGKAEVLDLIGKAEALDLIGKAEALDLIEEEEILSELLRRKGEPWLRSQLDQRTSWQGGSEETPGEPESA
ncbi:hypothetical protein [Candidatus Entotheonella palauensis]|uniref:hypothetical protein n=1 Tax=Candidatus Entotheonella palauensis TaxID=93172 RepID=UPI000B7E2434|nr:hypothetical protein [Candidatus Entotheonella palauensis]